jgi:hypothetical protein
MIPSLLVLLTVWLSGRGASGTLCWGQSHWASGQGAFAQCPSLSSLNGGRDHALLSCMFASLNIVSLAFSSTETLGDITKAPD